MSDVESKSALINKVVLVRLSFGVLGNSRKVSQEVLTTDADLKLLKVQKTLLDSEELRDIIQSDTAIRNVIKSKCLPYDSGLLLLPNNLKFVVHEILQTYEEQRSYLVDEFIKAYPALCQKASQRLGSLYSQTDYPSPEAVREKFNFEYQYLTFAPPGAEQMGELTEAAKEKFQEKVTQVTDHITVLLRGELLEAVAHLKSSLEPNADGKPKRLFSSAVTNVQEFLASFKDRNIINDADLEKVVEELSKTVHPNFSVDVLKDDETFKKDFHAKMEAATTKLTELVEVIPGRKFKNVS